MNNLKKFWQLAIFQIFKSGYCVSVFLASLIIITLFAPRNIFHHNNIFGYLFIVTTSLLITCLVRNIKEKVFSARLNGASVLGVISIILGFGALEVCAISAPVCGLYIGTGFLALAIPNFALNFFEKYNLLIILFSFVFQFFALYQMNCFSIKKCSKK